MQFVRNDGDNHRVKITFCACGQMMEEIIREKTRRQGTWHDEAYTVDP